MVSSRCDLKPILPLEPVEQMVGLIAYALILRRGLKKMAWIVGRVGVSPPPLSLRAQQLGPRHSDYDSLDVTG